MGKSAEMKRTSSPAARAESEPDEHILLVEDDVGLQKQMRWALAPYKVDIASNRLEALAKLSGGGAYHIVILDLGLPPDENGASEGLRALDEILSSHRNIKIIVASGNVERANAVRAVARGAFDFITKPIDVEVLKLVIQRGFRMHELEEENRALREDTDRSASGLIFACQRMAQVSQMIERMGPMDVSVLLEGETGTGKDVVARALHDVSPRKAEPFIAINCASIPENLLESELFGHERGAFTGAIKRTHGKFELANNGTLFLDEIGDMPPALQAKLLRFLQDRTLERIGGRDSIAVNVRLICATNQKLEKLIAEQKFREDLFYRINDVRLELPPLRERDGDSAVLAQHFLNTFNRLYYKQISGFAESALQAIAAHRWPGNVRELENRVKRAVIMSADKRITAADLDLADVKPISQNLDIKTETEKLEKKLAREALAITQGNVSKAAKLLGVSRPHLYNLLGQG
jgi:two-component system NtrC family response regulator